MTRREGVEADGRSTRGTGPGALPAWIRPADEALGFAARRVQLIRAVTPSNAQEETAALEGAFQRRAGRAPRFRYEPQTVPRELPQALEKLALFVEGQGELGRIYAARALELALEAEMVDAVSTPRLLGLAAARFLVADHAQRDLVAADALAREWLEPASSRDAETGDAERVSSADRGDPRSLVCRMASEVGRRKLPFRVVVEPGLASLAATGDDVILIADGRRVRTADVERTVLHEIEGHALPRLRAKTNALGIFSFGTARGVDDQEGRALLIEEVGGHLTGARRRELALRHVAARTTLAGAAFAEVVAMLTGHGASVEDAVRITARAQRGAPAGGGGIAREVVYILALLRVRRARAAHGSWVEQTMRCGRIAAEEARVMGDMLGRAGPIGPLGGEPQVTGEAGSAA